MIIVSFLKPIQDVYIASQNTITVHGAYSMDESLVPYHGRNGIHHKIPRKVCID